VSVHHKVLSTLFISLLLLSGLTAGASLVKDPYQQLADWLGQNLRVYGLTMYRGEGYSVIGSYKEPFVKYALNFPNGTARLGLTDKFSDYMSKMRQGLLNPWVNLTYFGYGRRGPITVEWPRFSFIYNVNVDPRATIWGSYFPKNTPSEGFMTSEAEPYTAAVYNFPLAEPRFSTNPQYLYSYLKMSDGAVVTLPKGENINFVILPVGDIKFEDEYLYTALKMALTGKASLSMPSSLNNILNALPKDDPMASVLVVNWSVEGNRGYIKPIATATYEHITARNLTLSGYYSGVIRKANDAYEDWYRRSVENAVKELERTPSSLKLERTSTRVLAPVGMRLKDHSTVIDLSNTTPSNMLLTSGVAFIIDPTAYGGNVDLRLNISDVRGRFSLTYKYTIQIGDERFNISLDGFFSRSKSSKPAGYAFENKIVRDWFGSIGARKKGYDEDGSLILSLTVRESHRETSNLAAVDREGDELVYKPVTPSTEGGRLERTEELTYSAEGGGDVKIGGWVPNPPPPGNVIEVQHVTLKGSAVSIKKDIDIKPQSYVKYERRYWIASEPPASGTGNTSRSIELFRKWDDELYDYKQKSGLSDRLDTGIAEVGRDYFSQASLIIELNQYLLIVREGSSLNVLTALMQEQVSGTQSGREISYGLEYTKHYFEKIRGYYDPCCGGRYITGFEASSHPTSSTSVLSDRWEAEEWTFYPFNRTRIYAFTGAIGTVPPRMPDILAVYLEKTKLVTNENVTGYLAAYGEKIQGLKVRLLGYLAFNETSKMPIRIQPTTVTLDDVGAGFFRVTTPTLQEINSTLKIRPLPSTLSLYLYAEDDRGINSTFRAPVRILGKLLIVDFRDVDIPLPRNIKQENLLKNLRWDPLGDNPLIDKPLPKKTGGNFYYEARLVNKETKELASSVKPDETGRAILDLTDLKPGTTYIINYTLSVSDLKGGWVGLKVKDAGVDITVREEDLYIQRVKVYAPASIISRYITLQQSLLGEDNQYRMLISDQAIPIQAIKNIFNIQTEPESKDPSDALLTEIIRGVVNYVDKVGLHVGPKIVFPRLGTEEIKGTELEFLDEPLTYRNFRYRLSLEDLTLNPDNYWSKMGKLIILQAHMLKNSHYAQYLTLAAARLMALAATLETYKGFLSYTKIWNKNNLFAWFNNKFPGKVLPQKWGTFTGTAKIGTLTLEGDMLNVLGFTNNWLGGMSMVNQYLTDLYGSREAASIAIAASFKLIRFLAAALIGRGEFWAEISFEVLFQAISFLAAHTMMLIYNGIQQMIILGELEKHLDLLQLSLASLGGLGIPPFFGIFLKLQLEMSPTYAELASPLRASINPSQKQTWAVRKEQYALLGLSTWDYLEDSFYAVANVYKDYLYPVTSIVLSTRRGLDGIKQKLAKDSFSAPEKLMTFMNLPVTYQVTIRGEIKTFSTKLNDVLAKAYLALIAALVSDGITKVAWNLAYYNFIIKGGSFERFAAPATTAAQALLPAFTFLLVARAPIKASLASAPVTTSPAETVKPRLLTRTQTEQTSELNRMLTPLPQTTLVRLNVAQSNRLANIAATIQSKGYTILDSAQTQIYKLKDFEELSNALDEADLILTSSIQSLNDPTVSSELVKHRLTYIYTVTNLRLLIDFLMANPSYRPTTELLNLLQDAFSELANITKEASTLLQTAEEKGLLLQPEGPSIIVRTNDIFWAEDGLQVTVYNMGGADAKVSLSLVETPFYTPATSQELTIKSKDKATITLKPALKQKLPPLTFVRARVYVNGLLTYDVDTEVQTPVNLYEAKEDNLMAVSDAPLTLSGGKIKITNSTFLTLAIQTSESDHFILLMDGEPIRSGMILGTGVVVVSTSFRAPIAGAIEFKKVSAESGSISAVRSAEPIKGITLFSEENIEGRVTVYKENPYAEGKLTNVEKAVYLAVDITEATKEVTIKIRYGDLGFTDPAKLSLYKYRAEHERYVAIKYEINTEEKTIKTSLRQGDPILAVVQTKTTQATQAPATESTAETTATTGPLMSLGLPEFTPYIIAILAAGAVVGALYATRRAKRR